MNRIFILLLTSFLIASCQKNQSPGSSVYTCNFSFKDSSATNPRSVEYQSMLYDMVQRGTVGVTMSVYNPKTGMWVGAAGKADLNAGVPMQACHISRMGSTIKMFTATVVLMLAEEMKIDLDEKAATYLPQSLIQKIDNADEATIAQLLQHSSGIYNYIQNLQFQTASLNNLKREWHAGDLLRYAWNKKAYFAPGSDVRYSNTNYILLGLLIERLEGKPLYEVFAQRIFNPLHMTHTCFAGKNPVPDNIVRGYVDIYANQKLTESTYYSGWDYYTADGGLISNPYDMNTFFQRLMKGEIIKMKTLSRMLNWITPKEQDGDFYPVQYGMGIFRMNTPFGDVYFHSGDAIGYYANMMYIPSSGIVAVYAVNSNYGKLDEWVSTKKAIEKILSIVR